jgi:hypothetical protein
MNKKIIKLFWTIEINLLLWIGMTGAIFSESSNNKTYAVIGLAVAAILQHWAYYDIYKESKKV